MTKKSSGATATEKVAALVAPAGEQRCCAHHCQGHSVELFSKKKVYAQNVRKFSENFRQSQKKQKKGFRPQIHKFSSKFVRQKLFLQVLLRSPRRNNIAHDFGTFSTGQKIVLSSSRGLAGLEAKAKDFTFEAYSRLRTSNCVLEAKDVLEDFSGFFYIVCLFFRFCS